MRDAVARDMAWAANAFEDNWYRVAPLIGGGELIANEDATVEGSTSQLDMISGIDWFIQRPGLGGVPINIPLASRTQDATATRTARPWASFTVREKRHGSSHATELQRRRTERATPGVATPHLVCQMYVDKDPDWRSYGDPTGNFVIAGIAKEADVLAAVDAGLYVRKLNTREQGRAVDFLAVWWIEHMRENGYSIDYVCGDGVWLVSERPQINPVIRRRKPCPGCGYFYAVHGSHRVDCAVEQISQLEAQAAIATVFDSEDS